MRARRRHLDAAVVIGLLLGGLAAATARAQPLPTSVPAAVAANVVTLSASASLEVAKDWLSVTFGATREGADAATVQAALRTAQQAALAEARKLARPGQVELQTGGFSLSPRYTQPKPGSGQASTIAGWQGSTELVVEGRDSAAIAQLTTRVVSMAIVRVASSLSREARQQVEADVTAQAVARFKDRASAVAQHFGFATYTLREIQVGSEALAPPVPAYARAAALRAGGEDTALPLEGGKASVTVSVTGSVQLGR